MTQYSKVIDAQSVGSGGGTQTSSDIELNGFETLTVKVDGDGNSSNFDLEIRGKLFEGGSYGVFDDSVTSEDITGDNNNSRLYTFDVSDVNDAQVHVVNNAGSSTTVTVKVGKTRGVQR